MDDVNTNVNTGTENEDVKDSTATINGESESKGEKEAKTFTESEVNAIVEKRLGREKKKTDSVSEELNSIKEILAKLDISQVNVKGIENSGANDKSKETKSENGSLLDLFKTQGVIKEEKKLDPSVLKAQRKLVNVTAKAYATGLGVSAENVDDVITLAKLSKVEIDKDGEFEESDVQKAITAVLEKHKNLAGKVTKKATKFGKGDSSDSTKPLSKSEKFAMLMNN